MEPDRRTALAGIQERGQVLGMDLPQVPGQDSASVLRAGSWTGPKAADISSE
jgi:hypothetical protein